MTQLPLDAKVALVTGAETEIGAAVAAELARSGAAVAVQYLTSFTRAKQVVRGIEGAGGQAVAIKADLQDRAQAELLCKKAGGAFGDVDILVVTDPGRSGPPSHPDRDPATELADTVRARLLDCLAPVYAALPTMVGRGTGSLVYICGSALAGTGTPGPAHAITSAAVRAALDELAREYGSFGIQTHVLPADSAQQVGHTVALLVAEGSPARAGA
ncbi:SDR family NAD(P)-dependent oxidoreductase [Streptomyces sp. CoH27]|uniref:SDR family NAD(P)-dependent oxidoreductase n=1 Tax=Streptomyces sp. CoH27 TaxID=2875763 RepID=UPI001CD4610C|nr:SDR family NAD(P)-dependent oxidoreductase [Streptomyces sp. CoH27]